ncbi:MAG: hypothetical protein PHI64_00730 [Zoogloea sp.]|uniref:hypothetical protein n=1 Tax=Zoogloea sp. TaxID=49181 RepID=UPI00260BBA1F|nr:hypothetical protein [Zoogloea sp.]MDD2987458.1 hypothetical protein [Zoogloea sp.]
MADPALRPIQRDWLSKTLAGLVLGAILALACSGLFARLNTAMPLGVRGQLAMWMVPPVWLGVLGGVYFFSSGVRAWLWLGAASAFVTGVFYLL